MTVKTEGFNFKSLFQEHRVCFAGQLNMKLRLKKKGTEHEVGTKGICVKYNKE